MASFKQSFARFLVLFVAHARQAIVATSVLDADEEFHQQTAKHLRSVSLLAGTEGPMAFHLNVEPVFAHSVLRSMLSPDKDDGASVEHGRNVLWSAGAQHHLPTHQVANVSLLVGAEGSLASHSRFEPTNVRSLLGSKAHRQPQPSTVLNVSLLSGEEGPLALHSSYVPLTASAQRQRQANKAGNVSLLAGAERPLAFHSNVEPIAVRALLSNKAHRQPQPSTFLNVSLLSVAEGPLAPHSSYVQLTASSLLGSKAQRQRQANKAGNVSLLAGAEGPLAFHSSVEPIGIRSLPGSKAHRQPQSNMVLNVSLLSGAEGPLALHSSYVPLTAFSLLGGKAQRQHQSNKAGNVSLRAGTEGPLAFHSSVQSATVHSLLDSKAHRQGEFATAGSAQENHQILNHGDRNSSAASIPAFFSEWRSSYADDTLSFDDVFVQDQHDTSVEPGQSVLSSARVLGKKAANVSLLAGTEGPLAFHSSVEPTTVHSLLGSNAHQQQNFSSAGSEQKTQLKSDHGDGQSRSASIPAFFSEWRSSLHDDAVSFDDILAQGTKNIATTTTHSHTNSVPLASHTLPGVQPTHNHQIIATGTMPLSVHPRSGWPGLVKSLFLPAFLSEQKRGSGDPVASFDDILARDVEDAVSSKQNGTVHSIAGGPDASATDANPLSTFLPPRSPPDSLLRTKFALRQPIGPRSPRWFESDADGYDAGYDPAYSRAGRNLVQTDFDESSRFWPGYIPHGGMGREHGSGPQNRALTHSRFSLPPNPLMYVGFPRTSLHGGTGPAQMPSILLMAMAFAFAMGA